MKKTTSTAFSLILWFVLSSNIVHVAMPQPISHAPVAIQQLSSESDMDNEFHLHVNGSETYSIHDRTLNATGPVYIEDSATLDVRNATLILTRPFGSPTNDVLIATDSANILIENSTIIINNNGHDPEHGDYVTFSEYNQAEINITRSTFQGYSDMDQVRIFAYDASAVNIKDSNLTEQLTYYNNKPGEVSVIGWANASLHILNSTLWALGLRDNSTASIRNGNLKEIFTGESSHRNSKIDNMSLNLIDSKVISGVMGDSGFCMYFIQNSDIMWLAIGPNSSAYVENTSGNQLGVDANSEALLVRSSWNHIDTYKNGRILVGDWFFGLRFPGIAGVPYTWVSPLQILIIATAIVVAITLVYVGMRRKRRHSDKADPSLTQRR
jgi:hypothetical protein